MARFDLSDEEWSVIGDSAAASDQAARRAAGRRPAGSENGIFYGLRTGAPWRDLPERYGHYTTVYNRYNRWSKAGVWFESPAYPVNPYPSGEGRGGALSGGCGLVDGWLLPVPGQ